MLVHVQTRGLIRDYRFLGSAPAKAWWSEYGQSTSFERPTLLVIGEGSGGWRLYASGITSPRVDRTNTRIRFTLVLESGAEPADADAGLARNVVGAWLDGGDGSGPDEPLSTALHDVFTEDVVEKLLAGEPADNDVWVTELARDALSKLRPARDTFLLPDDGSSWVGRSDVDERRDAFAARVTSLLRGEERGYALRLNLIGEQEAGELVEATPGRYAILVDDPGLPSEPKLLPGGRVVAPSAPDVDGSVDGGGGGPKATWAAGAATRGRIRKDAQSTLPGIATFPLAKKAALVTVGVAVVLAILIVIFGSRGGDGNERGHPPSPSGSPFLLLAPVSGIRSLLSRRSSRTATGRPSSTQAPSARPGTGTAGRTRSSAPAPSSLTSAGRT